MNNKKAKKFRQEARRSARTDTVQTLQDLQNLIFAMSWFRRAKIAKRILFGEPLFGSRPKISIKKNKEAVV